MRLEHPIFSQPLAAGVELEPNDWEKDFDPRGTWLVQTGDVGRKKGNDYGVVSDGHGFEDSPDCERISGGVNSKGPFAVAIGRQANLLQWGFYAAPDRMTESARKVFRNAIVYMKQFDGRRPLVKKEARSRDWFKQYVHAAAKLDTLEESRRDSYAKYIKGQFPAKLIEESGLDPKALQAWLDANVEYMRGNARRKVIVDEDLAKLKLSNRKPEFLDWLTDALTKDPSNTLALDLAKRYLGDDGRDAATALNWIRTNRQRAFFSDQGGYRWYVDTNAKKAARRVGTRSLLRKTPRD